MSDEEALLAELEGIVNGAAEKIRQEPEDTTPLTRTTTGWVIDIPSLPAPALANLASLYRVFLEEIAPLVAHDLLHNPYTSQGDDAPAEVVNAALEWDLEDHTPQIEENLTAAVKLADLLDKRELVAEEIPDLNRAALITRQLLYRSFDEIVLSSPTTPAALYAFAGWIHQGACRALLAP